MSAVLPILGSIVAKLGWALLTEAVVKHVAVYTLEMAARSSDNDLDDKILAQVKRAWGVE
jgi:hypothetical protein